MKKPELTPLQWEWIRDYVHFYSDLRPLTDSFIQGALGALPDPIERQAGIDWYRAKLAGRLSDDQ